MTIKYFWEDMIVNEEYDSGDLEPHTRPVKRDVNYHFDIEVKVEDIVDYLMPYKLEDKKEESLSKFYMTKAIQYLKDNVDFYFDDLENDSYFVEFMKERYKDKALEEWESENEAY